MNEFLKVATLTEGQVSRIRALELATGKHIMAFESGLKIAELTEDDLQRVRELEEQLNATLLVFESG